MLPSLLPRYDICIYKNKPCGTLGESNSDTTSAAPSSTQNLGNMIGVGCAIPFPTSAIPFPTCPIPSQLSHPFPVKEKLLSQHQQQDQDQTRGFQPLIPPMKAEPAALGWAGPWNSALLHPWASSSLVIMNHSHLGLVHGLLEDSWLSREKSCVL